MNESENFSFGKGTDFYPQIKNPKKEGFYDY